MARYDRNVLLEDLRKNVMAVYFTKVNGEKREMRCTLNEKYIPKKESEGTKKENSDVLAVWDIDNKGWRSFRLDSVTKVEVMND